MQSFASLPGLRVGHAQNETALTGCTVILCDGSSGAGAIGGIDQRGGAPGTRETDALHPMHLVEKIHAIVLAGGSAFGLEAATGVVRYLEERGVGFDVRVAKVPIVPAAILFDLAVGAANVVQLGAEDCHYILPAGASKSGKVRYLFNATPGPNEKVHLDLVELYGKVAPGVEVEKIRVPDDAELTRKLLAMIAAKDLPDFYWNRQRTATPFFDRALFPWQDALEAQTPHKIQGQVIPYLLTFIT